MSEAQPKPSDTCLSMCVYVCVRSTKPYMHKKGTLKTFGEDKKKPMRDHTSTYFYLFIIRIILKSTEKRAGWGGRVTGMGGWGGVKE